MEIMADPLDRWRIMEMQTVKALEAVEDFLVITQAAAAAELELLAETLMEVT